MIPNELLAKALDVLSFRFDRHLDREARENYRRTLDLLTLLQFDTAIRAGLRKKHMPSPGDLCDLGTGAMVPRPCPLPKKKAAPTPEG